MIDRQQIFNTAYRGLASQGFIQSAAPKTGTCLYRGPEGRRCALGWCIPDENYRQELEGLTIDDYPSILEDALGFPDLPENDIQFLVDLQTYHDQSTDPDKMKLRLADLANTYGLEVPTDD